MPIIVEEIVISIDVSNESTGGAGSSSRAAPAGAADADRQALVQECVERVLEILRHREER